MMEQKRNRIAGWIPGWNLHGVMDGERMENHLNGWSLSKAKIAI